VYGRVSRLPGNVRIHGLAYLKTGEEETPGRHIGLQSRLVQARKRRILIGLGWRIVLPEGRRWSCRGWLSCVGRLLAATGGLLPWIGLRPGRSAQQRQQ